MSTTGHAASAFLPDANGPSLVRQTSSSDRPCDRPLPVPKPIPTRDPRMCHGAMAIQLEYGEGNSNNLRLLRCVRRGEARRLIRMHRCRISADVVSPWRRAVRFRRDCVLRRSTPFSSRCTRSMPWFWGRVRRCRRQENRYFNAGCSRRPPIKALASTTMATAIAWVSRSVAATAKA